MALSSSNACRGMETYVFGAGASAPYGAPTMTSFLREAFLPWDLHDHTHFDKELRIVAETIDKQYGTRLTEAQGEGHISSEAAIALEKVNLEELLALADENDDSQLRTALERVIFNTLERSINVGQLNGEYKKLLSQLIVSGREVCLISFNYDLLLDRTLADATRRSTNNWSYGVTFHAGIEGFPSYRDVADPTVFLLKLHGSLNWGQCQTCRNLRLHAYNTYDNIFRQTWPHCQKCSGSSTKFKPVLVAPTPAKQIPSTIESAWGTAANCLEKTEKLTVIGYSFPGLDRKSRTLFLKHFIIPNLFAHSRPKLAIVDKDGPTRKALKLWFLPAVDKNIEEYCSFEEYCAML